MNTNTKWIKPTVDFKDVCPTFSKRFICKKNIEKALISITAMGAYEAELNGERIGDFILAPGFTHFSKRLQVQTYDVTALLKAQDENDLTVTVGRGWYRGFLPGWLTEENRQEVNARETGIIAELTVLYTDGTQETVSTDDTWSVFESKVRFSEIYDGEIFDASYEHQEEYPVAYFDGPTETLIPQQGEEIREQERIRPVTGFVTPKGEVVFDFGQNLTGYIELSLDAAQGEQVSLSFAEVMDQEGNFYTENYRSAKCQYIYTCKEGRQTYKPKFTFYGFRYIRVNAFPGGTENAKAEHFTAIEVHSDMKRTGYVNSSDPMLNKLFENIIWGQKDNFVDIPTDCPQRDERMGWTGDAQVFIRTACLNFDVEKFFTKWLADMAAGQKADGRVGHYVPILWNDGTSAAWHDAATICPWTLYLAYGDPEILKQQYDCMEKWVGYITAHTKEQYLWTGGDHFGDWLGLDAPQGSYTGSSRKDFIATCFYAYSTELLVKAGKVLEKDMSAYESLYANIVQTFRKTYPVYKTQTECVLAAHFRLAEDLQRTADQLADMVRACGVKLQTGFLGTPYLLHVLSDHGHTELAYDLLLRKQYPSWLYPITKGATTIWEHWDGIMENGDFWSADMNSYNHYAYGAVADWIYCKAGGIQTIEAYPGYEKVKIAPLTDERLDWLEVRLDTRHGQIISYWYKQDEAWRYEITTPVEAEIVIGEQTYKVEAGKHIFYQKR